MSVRSRVQSTAGRLVSCGHRRGSGAMHATHDLLTQHRRHPNSAAADHSG